MHAISASHPADPPVGIELADLEVFAVEESLSQVPAPTCGTANYTYTLSGEPAPDEELVALSA